MSFATVQKIDKTFIITVIALLPDHHQIQVDYIKTKKNEQ